MEILRLICYIVGMKIKVLFKICLMSLLLAFLFGSCKREADKGHLLRVIVYYPCPGYSSDFVYPSAPQKENFGIYQVLVKIKADKLTGEMLDEMTSRVKACGIQNFSGKWYKDYNFSSELNPGKLTSQWEDNYYNYMVYTKVDEDLTPRFTEYIVRDSKNIYRLNSSHKDIFPLDTTTVSFSDELLNKSYNPHEVSKVYYINQQTGLKESEWHEGDSLQGKKLFVDLNSNWSEQNLIKFVNSEQRFYATKGPYQTYTSIQNSMKINDFFPNIFNREYDYLKIYKGSFLENGEIQWDKNKVYTAEDIINPYELIRIQTCKIKLNVYMIDSSGKTEDFTRQYDYEYEFDDELEEDNISEYDLGEIGNTVNEQRSIVHAENSSWVPKAYYKADSINETAGIPEDEVWTTDSSDIYIQIKDGCKTDKIKNKIYILVEGTL